MKALMSRLDAIPKRQTLANGEILSGSRSLLSTVSIVIPVAPEDESWRLLIGDLDATGTDAELLLVGTHREPTKLCQIGMHGLQDGVRWAVTTSGRAHQMNYGATLATRPYLWFLHADSRISIDALSALERSLKAHPQALHYFDLAYQDDGPKLVRLNALGARVRSRYLGLPFGDQGLCMSRDVFQRLGGFDESAAYGEDHLLVWAAHRDRVPLCRVTAFISTSARKYRTNGWFATTLIHTWRTWRQAAPQLIRLLRSRFR